MAYSFKPLSNNQVYITQDGRAMGTFSTADAAKYGYGAPTTPQNADIFLCEKLLAEASLK